MVGQDLWNSSSTGTIASGAGLRPCAGRVRRLAFGSATATASAASGMPGKVWSPEETIAGTVTAAQRSRQSGFDRAWLGFPARYRLVEHEGCTAQLEPGDTTEVPQFGGAQCHRAEIHVVAGA